MSNDWVIVARFGKPQGLKGLVNVYSFTEPYDNLLNYQQLYIQDHGQWKLLTGVKWQRHDSHLLASIPDVDDRDKAALLTNKDIALSRQALPALPPGEYYWDELIGMQVINQAKESLGVVTEILATGSNDVLVIQDADKRHLVPYLMGDYIVAIDPLNRSIEVNWDKDF